MRKRNNEQERFLSFKKKEKKTFKPKRPEVKPGLSFPAQTPLPPRAPHLLSSLVAKAKALPTLDCNTQSRELIPFVPKTSVPVRPLKPRAAASLTWKPIRLHRVPRILARCLRHPRAPGIQLEPAASARATTPRRRGVSGRAWPPSWSFLRRIMVTQVCMC